MSTLLSAPRPALALLIVALVLGAAAAVGIGSAVVDTRFAGGTPARYLALGLWAAFVGSVVVLVARRRAVRPARLGRAGLLLACLVLGALIALLRWYLDP